MSWVTYLGDKTGHDADRLILEAVDLFNDISLEVRYAEKYADVHPGLYLNILESGKSVTANDMVSIGLKAMEMIPKKYVMRSRSALKTAEYLMKSVVPMSSDIRNCAIKRITALLKKWTAGIMDANRRNYYGECAAYIAALGEAQESMGEMGAKQKLMTSYKDAYPRRSAFREEMRKYGWIDIKRK